MFVSPGTWHELRLHATVVHGDEVEAGTLTTDAGERFPIETGIPDFLYPSALDGKSAHALKYFDDNADDYEQHQHLTYETFYQNETDVRNRMIDLLQLRADHTVLEVNAGSGRDSVLIGNRLGENGLLHVQDIAPNMLRLCQKRLAHLPVPVAIHRGNGCFLPYRDKSFDAVYSFGGIGVGTYADPRSALEEMARVTRPGGRIVIGGGSMAPWLRETFFAKVLMHHNYLYKNTIPFEAIPVAARDVRIQWILGGGFFVLDFTVGEGEPAANFDFEIPGVRGGTLRTRYLGQLEGVTPATKELALRARAKTGESMHAWLDEVVRTAALDVLGAHEERECTGSKKD